MRKMTVAMVLALVCAAAMGEGLAQGPWVVHDGTYSMSVAGDSLYYLTGMPYINGQGSIEATVTPKRSLRTSGWGTSALHITMGPGDFWTLGLVEGPDGQHYTELVEDYQGRHQAQSQGPTRLVPIEGTYSFDWQYGHTYRLRLAIEKTQVMGEVFEGGAAKPVARLGYQLAEGPALREGWGGLRAEMMDTEFAQVKVTTPATPAAGPAKAYPQGRKGCVGMYFGEDLPGAEKPPALDELGKKLRAAGFETARLTSAELGQAGTLSYPGLKYLVADVRRLPNDAVGRLLAWMRQGGILVSVAAPAFGKTFYNADGKWETWEEYSQHGLAKLAGKGREIVGWTETGLGDWGANKYDDTPSAELSVEKAATPNGEDALAIREPGFTSGWWSLGTTFPSPAMRDGEALTCFWARGDANTPEMSIEWAEEDGSRWIAVVSLETKWRFYALPPQAFRYWPDNPSKGRGGAGDMLRPAQAVRLAFGISDSHTRADLRAGIAEHRIWIGPIRAASVPPKNLSLLAPASRPEMEALSPGYKLFEVKGARTWTATAEGKLWGLPAKLPVVPALSAVRRPEGEGFARGYWWRWVPLIQTKDASGRYCGAPMSLLISEMMPMPRTAWVNCGLQRLSDFGPAMQDAVAAVIARLSSAPVLFEGGAENFLYRPTERIALGAKVVAEACPKTHADVAFTMTTEIGREPVIPGGSVDVEPRGIGTARSSLKALPVGQYWLFTDLLVGGRVVDRIKHPLTVEAAPAKTPPASEVVQRRGGGLYLDGKPWHPVACNYWPHTLGGTPTPTYGRGWVDPDLYDPEVVEADLTQMESWGFKAIAAVGAELNWSAGEQTVRDALDFLGRCQRHHIKVFLFVQGLDPRGRDDARAKLILRTVHNCPAIAGYDIAWEPGYWAISLRRKYAPQWREWLEAQYGSINAAEAALGYKLPRDEKGQVDVPPDLWGQKDGKWRKVEAAFRNYWNWQMGAEYRYSVSLVRSIDKVHLIGFRGSSTGSVTGYLPVEQPAVLHFMDWAGPEDYDVPAYGKLTPWAWTSARGLITRMFSHLSGGKPVVWMEYGMPIYPNGTVWKDSDIFIPASEYEYQVKEGEEFWRMQVESGAWGSMVWWYPGGWRTGENSDCGLVNSDNRPRPVALAEKAYVPKFAASETFKPDTYLQFKPEQVGGWVGEYVRLRAEYAKLVAEGHKVGVKTVGPIASADCPLVDPSGAAWSGKGPLRYLDSIFERVRVKVGDGAWVEVALPNTPEAAEVKVAGEGPVQIEAWAGNLAEAKWLPGGVVLQVRGEGKGEGALAKAVEFQGSAHFGPVKVADRMGGAMTVKLQLAAKGRAAFGEIVKVRLVRKGG